MIYSKGTIENLRGRARFLRIQSYLILLLIVGTIGGGSGLFYFAPQVAGSNIESVAVQTSESAGALVEHLNEYKANATAWFASVNATRQEYREMNDNYLRLGNELESIKKSLSDEMGSLKSRVDSVKGLDSRQVVEILNYARNSAEAEFQSSLDQLFEEYSNQNIVVIGEDSSVNCIRINAASTRFVYECPYNNRYAAAFEACDHSTKFLGANLRRRIYRCDSEVEAAVWKKESTIARLSSSTRHFGLAAKEIENLSNVDMNLSGDWQSRFGALSQAIDNAEATMAKSRVVENSSNPLTVPSIDTDSLTTGSSELGSAIVNLKNIAANFSDVPENWYSFIEQSTIRITVVVLIIFLVQILVNLFRYGTRLAAFYDARADVLGFISDNDLELSTSELHAMVMSFAPDSLDFGKSPRSPIDSAVELSRQIVTARKTM